MGKSNLEIMLGDRYSKFQNFCRDHNNVSLVYGRKRIIGAVSKDGSTIALNWRWYFRRHR